MSPSRTCAPHGYTLIELMATLAIVSILTGIAVPGLSSMIRDNRRAAAVNDVLASVQLARSEAALWRRSVVICPVDGVTGACVRSRDWSNGWIVAVDRARDGPPGAEAGLAAVRRFQPGGPLRVTANLTSFTFRPFNATATNGTWTICDDRGAAHARAVTVSPSGRARVSSTGPLDRALDCS